MTSSKKSGFKVMSAASFVGSFMLILFLVEQLIPLLGVNNGESC